MFMLSHTWPISRNMMGFNATISDIYWYGCHIAFQNIPRNFKLTAYLKADLISLMLGLICIFAIQVYHVIHEFFQHLRNHTTYRKDTHILRKFHCTLISQAITNTLRTAPAFRMLSVKAYISLIIICKWDKYNEIICSLAFISQLTKFSYDGLVKSYGKLLGCLILWHALVQETCGTNLLPKSKLPYCQWSHVALIQWWLHGRCANYQHLNWFCKLECWLLYRMMYLQLSGRHQIS